MNKTNKQAKYNQRHGNKEKPDSNQRRKGRGIIGEGTSRNMYKGHLDKAEEGKFEDGRKEWVGQGRHDNCI